MESLASRQHGNALSQSSEPSNKPTEITLLKEMYLTAVNAKTELDPHMSQELLREFANESPEAITWAFRQWRAASPYWPAICDLWRLIGRYHEKRAVEIAEEEQVTKRAAAARRMAAGDKMISQMEQEELLAAIRAAIQPMDKKPSDQTAGRGRLYEPPAPDQLRDRVVVSKRNLKEWLEDHPEITRDRWPAEFAGEPCADNSTGGRQEQLA
jgi:hypothetical protein